MLKWRTYIVLFLTIVFAGGIIYRLTDLQIFQHEYYSALAQGQHNFFKEIKGERGKILAQQKNKEPVLLATNNSWFLLFSCPNKIKNKEETALKLSKVIDLKKDEILNKISQEKSYIVIEKGLKKEKAEEIRELNLGGVYLSKKGGRYYPYNTLASNVLGFVETEHNNGQYGIEGAYNDLLKGEEGFSKGITTVHGYLLDNSSPEIEKGEDLTLTIDFNVQSVAENLLKEAKEKYEIEGGSITIMNPKKGNILALATLPNFNPNEYEKENKMEVFQNPVTQKLYEPGSVFKPITMAAALNENKIKPDTSYIDEGSVEINGWTIHNYHKKEYEEQTMTDVLAKSINTGAIFAQQKLGEENFLEYIDNFGFFTKTNIGLSEANSENKELKKEREVNLATASFGQGIEITPIQILRSFSAIANNGKIINPYIVERNQNENEKQIIEEL
ncbi:MAG: peptidoglycan D,D-transpeptidase FtsI family protein, partial [Minisyncoccales bacterium]